MGGAAILVPISWIKSFDNLSYVSAFANLSIIVALAVVSFYGIDSYKNKPELH
jgi:amino acid permease